MNENPRLTYQISITKEELAALPAAHFHGEISLIEKPEEVSAAVARLRECDVVGFDTETRPSFKKGQTNIVSLLQLSTRDICYLIRLNHIGLTDELKQLLEDPDVLKVGLSIHDDFHNLNKIASIEPRGFVDLQNYVKNFNISDNSLTKIYGIVFGKRISKGQRLTNWEASQLTESQQAYAALDAMACIDIYDKVSSGQFDPLQSPYLREIAEDRPAESQGAGETPEKNSDK